jgi:hypothetical protein
MKNNTMKNTLKFNRLPDNNDLYETGYIANYESKFDLGEFKIYNVGFGSSPYRIELNGEMYNFSQLNYRMGWGRFKYQFKSLKNCKERINIMITELSQVSYWVSK